MSGSNDLTRDSFQSVRSKKKRRRGPPTTIKPVSFSARLDDALGEIVHTRWIKECQKKVEGCLETLGWSPPEVLCLGLGSPMESRNAAMQLALLVSICDTLHIAHERISFFDPLFSNGDILGLVGMRFRVLPENNHGNYAMKDRTLLFMPHCGVELYENALRANWGAEESQRLLLFGNVLQDYATATPLRKFEDETPCLSRICKLLACDPVAPFEGYPSAFNNLGLQYMRRDSLPSPADDVWRLPPPCPDRNTSEVS